MFSRRISAPPHISVLLYLTISLALTLHSKLVLQSYRFGFPWLITALHSLSCICGTQLMSLLGYHRPAALDGPRQLHLLWAFSALYTINIAVSNVSLHYVSVPLHQVVRGTVPVFTILITKLVSARGYSTKVYVSLVPVVVGVGLATYGDYSQASVFGLLLTLLGTMLAATKTVVTNNILVGSYRLNLSAIDLLYHLSPLVFLQTALWTYATGELTDAWSYISNMHRNQHPQSWCNLAAALFVNGVIAFTLNIASFTASKNTSALAMTVTGNVKVVLTVILGCILFDVRLSQISTLGVAVTLFGGALYSYVRLIESWETKKNRFSKP